MISVTLFLVLALSAIDNVLGSPLESFDNSTLALEKRTITDGEGTSNGYFYSVYSDSTVTGTYTNGAAGEYTLTWGGTGDVVAGKGWATGGPMSVVYSGTYEPDGNSYLSVYGWTTDPLIEYYITESYGDYDPSTGGTYKGTCSSDGGEYDIYTQTRTNAPSIQGTATFQQYWSIRTAKRVGGTVTTGNHYACWEAVGLELGTFNYMILATEAYSSTGTSTMTVS
ncbi:xylanase G1 [Lentinula raphanica]|uniref:Endo-1,4-beta-xylanase n=1 Tax=Lentinula raphanica TaxID=153919 RepID=A0AA38PE03_9AGAR|nr:concanavalin A-like lectin/glucanase domain-containing protein [Lentinula raphanica]KAJ3841188.1 xylanase G1 [Lentinula raphanica]